MIGVAVPVHNEEQRLRQCLASLRRASRSPLLQGEQVLIVVVLDDCSDASRAIALAGGACTLEIRARNVGAARAAGAKLLLDAGARWLACTDADTVVAPDWLAAQCSVASSPADVVCGTVGVREWHVHGAGERHLRREFAARYRDADGHSHIHGANLGVCAAAYQRAGGFAELGCGEDVALIEALKASGARIAWSALPRVLTSARRDARARGGFGDTLLRWCTEPLQIPAVVI